VPVWRDCVDGALDFTGIACRGGASGGPTGCVTAGTGQFAAIQSAAASIGVEMSPVSVRDAPEIERAVTAFARSSNSGLIVTASSSPWRLPR
jgi:hypothetical protein